MPNHGCHNRQIPGSIPIMVQSGWTEDGRRNMVEIPYRNSKDCRYDLKLSDKFCNGCVHIGDIKNGKNISSCRTC